MKDTVLITGVTGQLGSYLADYYLEKGMKVTGFSRRTGTHSTDRIDHLMDNPSFTYLEGDITDPTFLVKLFSDLQPEFCVNTAAQSHVHSSFTCPASTWDITGKGAMNVIDALIAVSPTTRYVHLSTSEMFGDQYDSRPGLYMDSEEYRYQDERTRFNPQSPYAVAKLAAHHYNRLMRETHNVHLSSLIAFNYESHRRGQNFVTQKIVNWFKKFKKDSSIPKLRLGNLDAYRDWSHAADIVNAVDLMLLADRPGDYVVGSGETRTVREFLGVVCNEILEDDDFMKYVVIDPEFFRPAEVEYLRADATKIKNMLGWEPRINFNQLVGDMCHV